MAQTFRLVNDAVRANAKAAIDAAPEGQWVEIRDPKRSLDQNALMWSLLGELSNQVEWHGQRLTPENWKDVLTAALKRQAVVPGIDGGFVVLGTSTRRMTKGEMSELIELIYAFAAEREVRFAA